MGKIITQDGHKYIKARFLLSSNSDIITHLVLGSLRFLPMLGYLPRGLSPHCQLAAGGAG